MNAGTALHDKRYVVGRVLGQGGFGVTYLGYDSVFQRMVAIKEYMPTHLASRHRDSVTIISGHGENGENFISGLKLFIEEARNVAKLNRHANVVRVENYFEENNTAYMVMQYVKGPSLSTLMKERGGHMEWKEVCSFMLPILDALEMIHKKNIFHRDISLQNILLLDGKVPVLIDFGASRVVAGEQSRSIDIVLKPGYSPLEQFAAKGKIGPWTDIYAVGACMYLLMSGHLPPQATDRLYKDEIVSLSEIPGILVPEGVDEDIIRALAVRVEDRWQTVSDFCSSLKGREDVKVCLKEETIISAPAFEEKEIKSNFNPKMLIAVAVILIAIAVIAVAFKYRDSAGVIVVAESIKNDTVVVPEKVEEKKVTPTGGDEKLTEQEDQLLASANFLFNEGKFVSPAKKNAYLQYHQLLLGSAPAHKAGMNGLKRIIDVANKKISRGAWKVGLSLLLPMKSVKDSGLKEQVEAGLKDIRSKYVVKAKQLIEKGVGTTSTAYLSNALKASPGDEEARRLLNRARSLKGKVNIFCIPSGYIHVDGKALQKMAPTSGIEMLSGKHTITLVSNSSEAYPERSKKVDVKYGKTTLLKVVGTEFEVSYE